MEKFILTHTSNNFGPYHNARYEAVIFFFGCNLRCDFCYNDVLVRNEYDSRPDAIDGIEKLIDSFKKMKDKRSLYLTGGEILFSFSSCNDILLRVRELDPTIKLGVFTNGTFPSQLDDLICRKLVDFVHIDYKVPFSMEENTFGLTVQYLLNIKESIRASYEHLEKGDIDYLHLNTVLIDGIHSVDVIKQMIEELPMKTHPFFGFVDYDSPLEDLKEKKFLWYFTRLFQPSSRKLLNPEWTEETKRLQDEDLKKIEKFLKKFNKLFKYFFEENNKFHDKRRKF
jgi:pyruvate-formate lyase-activating enzyme